MSMNVDNRRSRRSVNNVTQLRDLLEELFNVDPDFALTLQGPPVSHRHYCGQYCFYPMVQSLAFTPAHLYWNAVKPAVMATRSLQHAHTMM